MSEVYIDTQEEISKLAEDIVKESKKADRIFRRHSDRVSFSDWIKMLTDYIGALQSDKQQAVNRLAEFNKDKEIQYWKKLYENERNSAQFGFPITKDEYEAINLWQRKHDAEIHGFKTAHERLRADGACGGRYFYRFVPTSIGISGECVCGSCHKIATSEAEGDNEEYRRQMEKLGGSYEFQELG